MLKSIERKWPVASTINKKDGHNISLSQKAIKRQTLTIIPYYHHTLNFPPIVCEMI